ncbi:hypothetical protein FACS189451_00610 [Bacteroidia bacterium]|nr:hypothetical protein FACS189451_00610 [Bacteroidia bacterium]
METTANQTSEMSVKQLTKKFFKRIRKQRPMLHRLEIKRLGNVYSIRARYGDRRLFACQETLE